MTDNVGCTSIEARAAVCMEQNISGRLRQADGGYLVACVTTEIDWQPSAARTGGERLFIYFFE